MDALDPRHKGTPPDDGLYDSKMESLGPHRGSPPANDGMSAARFAFPQTPEDFENDPRVSFSKLEDKWILEDDDGSEWEYVEKLKRWVPSLDEALLEKQREAYAIPGVDENVPSQTEKKKRKKAEIEHVEGDFRQKKPRKADNDKPKAERKNTAVYVTSIPLDVTEEEVYEVFSKCGVIAEEIDSTRPRIKLYTDDDGKFKGDALVVYFRPESVNLAIQMLDDTDFRLGVDGPQGKMRVKEADFSYKKQKEPQGDKHSIKEKKKVMRRTQKLNNKLADWDDDDPSAIQDVSSRWDKVVILKHMFTLQELEEDPAAILDIKEDIREECEKLGEVTNVVLFDKEKDGVATVRFGNSEAARACVRMMDGRSFAGQKVEAYIADGSERFKKSKEKKTEAEKALEGDDIEEEEQNRLDEFGAWLEKSEQV